MRKPYTDTIIEIAVLVKCCNAMLLLRNYNWSYGAYMCMKVYRWLVIVLVLRPVMCSSLQACLESQLLCVATSTLCLTQPLSSSSPAVASQRTTLICRDMATMAFWNDSAPRCDRGCELPQENLSWYISSASSRRTLDKCTTPTSPMTSKVSLTTYFTV